MARRAPARSPAAADKRDAILAAALALFNERSFHGTAMPLVAERAGVAAGTIYRYFESKEALGNAVFRHCKLAMWEFLASVPRAGSTARHEFHALWRGLWEFARKRPDAFRFLETHSHEHYLDAASRSTSDTLATQASEFVRRGQAAGAVRAGDARLLIALAFGAFVGLMKEADSGRVAVGEAKVAAAEDAVWSMLAAAAPVARRRKLRSR